MNLAYVASKGAVFGLTRALAIEGQDVGIKVNAIAPRATTRLANAATVAKVHGRRLEDMGAMPHMAPGFTAPTAAYLAHESCALNGAVSSRCC
jgi:NAD(P)-dependent dehydrogenase (short-subunit alcohol dehydrogenase family)